MSDLQGAKLRGMKKANLKLLRLAPSLFFGAYRDILGPMEPANKRSILKWRSLDLCTLAKKIQTHIMEIFGGMLCEPTPANPSLAAAHTSVFFGFEFLAIAHESKRGIA